MAFKHPFIAPSVNPAVRECARFELSTLCLTHFSYFSVNHVTNNPATVLTHLAPNETSTA